MVYPKERGQLTEGPFPSTGSTWSYLKALSRDPKKEHICEIKVLAAALVNVLLHRKNFFKNQDLRGRVFAYHKTLGSNPSTGLKKRKKGRRKIRNNGTKLDFSLSGI